MAVTLDSPRELTLPSGFNPQGALLVADGPTTYLVNNASSGDSTACVIVRATAEGARSYSYSVNNGATACTAFGTHPEGFLLRVEDPTAMEEIDGHTVFVEFDGTERWRVPDRRLVDAEGAPGGPGEFRGEYFGAIAPLLYSPAIDRVLGSSIGTVTIGQDVRYLGQHHLLNPNTGNITRNGFTLGSSGVGIPVGGVVRSGGDFLIVQDTLGLDGTVFHTWDGRSNVARFEPLAGEWEGKTLRRIAYLPGTTYLMWIEAVPEVTDDIPAFIAATNDDAATLWEANFETTYRFRNGDFVFLGPPLDLQVSPDWAIITYRWENDYYLRLIDENGGTPGIARLTSTTPLEPLGILATAEGVRLVTANQERIIEYSLEFEDVPDWDPNAILEDVGIDDAVDAVLDEAGCGCGAAGGGSGNLFLAIGFAVFSFVGRSRARRRR